MNQNIFMDKMDYKAYLELLGKYKQKYGFKLFSFALMPNQLDLLLELKEGSNISIVMHDLNSSYTKYFNSAYQRKGHLFRERFKSVVVEKEHYLLNLIEYIHVRPLALGMAREQSECIFTSSIFYLSENAAKGEADEGIRKIINMDNEIAEVQDLLKRKFPQKNTYADFIAGIIKEELKELSKTIEHSKVIGSERFIESVQRQIGERQSQIESRERKSALRPRFIFYLTIVLASSAAFALVFTKKAAQTVIVPQEKTGGETPVKTAKEVPVLTPPAGLDKTAWAVAIKPKAETEIPYPRLDKIVFNDGRVYSDYLLARGYAASNYSLTIQDDGTLLWETMQFNQKTQDRAFLRGEVSSQAMRGTIILRSKGREDATFYFNTFSLG